MPSALPAAELNEIVDRTRELWTELAAARIFVTGGTGFFGRWLLESFAWANRRLALGAQACVLSRDPEQFLASAPHLSQEPALTFLRGDAQSFVYPSGSFACVLHLATEHYDAGRDASACFERDLAGTRRTLDYAVQAHAARYLFTSSGAIYGKQPADLPNVPEDFMGAPDPVDANAGYAHAKRSGEFLCSAYAQHAGLHTTIARGFAFVGPHLPLDAGFAVGNFLRDALASRPIRIAGDGTPYRSYMHAVDLTVWLWTILLRGERARPYNVGSEHAVSIAELAREVAAVAAPQAQIVIAQASAPGRAASRYVPSVARARAELGLEQRISLRDGLARSVAWLRMT